MAWTTDTLDRFERITGYNYTQLMTDFFNFNKNKKQLIYDYYEGLIELSGAAFNELDRLRVEVRKSTSIATLNKESFNLFEDWEFFSELEDIDRKLTTIFNSSRFLRSAIATGNFNPNPLIEITLGFNQTLENLANTLNSNDPQNDWSSIFLQNQLTEEDYTNSNGALLKVTFQGADPLILTSVIDNIDTAEKTYGLDIDTKIQFIADNNDLKILTYRETLFQSAKILTELTKGSVPEFQNQGIDTSILGSTLSSVSFPSIFRQIYQNFTTDDGFKSFAITDATMEGDAFILTYQVRTRTDELVEGFLKL